MILPAITIESPSNPWVFVAWFGCLSGLYLFGRGVVLLRRRQQPRAVAKIEEVKYGPALVSGCVEGSDALKSPIFGKPCFYFRATLWRQKDPAKDDSWAIVAEETQGKRFVLKKESGRGQPEKTAAILVDPRDAEVDLPRDSYEEYGKTLLGTHTDIPAGLDAFLKRNKVNTEAAVRVEEYVLAPGDRVFVEGVVVANPALAQLKKAPSSEKRDSARNSKISAPNPATPQLIHLSPEPGRRAATEMTMQSRVAAALALARANSPEASAANPVHIPSISVAVHEEKPVALKAPVESNSAPKAPAVPATPQLQPFYLLKQQNGSRFSISHRQVPGPTPSFRRAVVFLATGPLVALASAYALLTILGLVERR